MAASSSGSCGAAVAGLPMTPGTDTAPPRRHRGRTCYVPCPLRPRRP
ncbi:hypothetical protein T261_01321 [Streptomyces lydicus]|nr:hypothetical protein T261_01321 [Streptomyces lydicus]